ncbi:MAG: Fic family protein [Candidatus Melainabacteria bacterium]|nr:MAG: Fic family protein [Candidatus Melainabacteria bacterium]
MQKREFFNNGQLTLLATAAVVCAEPYDGETTLSDEMAVYDMIANYTSGWTAEQLAVLKFCAEECERQRSGAISVYCMVNAWNHAIDCQHAGARLNDEMVLKLAEMVEPNLKAGWRTTTVTIGGIVAGSQPEYITRDMTELGLMLDAHASGQNPEHFGQPLTAQWLYERFEDIHPREDGNGRTGKIIFNWLTGTLDAPQLPTEPDRFSN